ncbi:hypothetical protein ACM66B_002611 [Microbotryomycetes sp. NB124-2]
MSDTDLIQRTSTPPILIRPPTPRRVASSSTGSAGAQGSGSSTDSQIPSPLWSVHGSPASPSSPFDTSPFCDWESHAHKAAETTTSEAPKTSPLDKGKHRQHAPQASSPQRPESAACSPSHSLEPQSSPGSSKARWGSTSADRDCGEDIERLDNDAGAEQSSRTLHNPRPSMAELVPTPNLPQEAQLLHLNLADHHARSTSGVMAASTSAVTEPQPCFHLVTRSPIVDDVHESAGRPRFLAKTKRRLSSTLAGLVSSSSPDLTRVSVERAPSPSTRSSSAPSLLNRSSNESTWKTKLGKRRIKMTKHLSFTRSVPVTRTTTLERQPGPIVSRIDEISPKATVKRARSQSVPILQHFADSEASCQVHDLGSADFAKPEPAQLVDNLAPSLSKTAGIDLFSNMLPREIQLQVVAALGVMAQDQLERDIDSGQWRSDESRRRWVGEALGRRDVVRVSRVSRAWRSLAFDGQHWQTVSTSVLGGDVLGPDQLLSIAQDAGPFVRDLDIRGCAALSGRRLMDLTNALMRGRDGTQLTSLDLSGCTSLTAASLHDLLIHSPWLTSINLMALRCVVFTTINVIDASTTRLNHLNVNRCANLNAAALTKLASNGNVTKLERLHAASLTNMTDDVLISIVLNQHDLQSLDVSHNVELSDRAFKAIAAVTSESVEDKPAYSLKRLNLSGCSRLSDIALKHLAGCVPDLETLELADMGPTLHPTGLVSLLKTVPNLRKLDLEQGLLLSDAVLLAMPTRQLEHLVISCCPLLTAGAMFDLIEKCDNLVTLEADGTTIDDDVARTFITTRFKQRALSSSTSTATRLHHSSSNVDTESPTPLLSLLDARFVSRRLQKEVQGMTRPRKGFRGHWTTPFMYHDGEDLGPPLAPKTSSSTHQSWLNKKTLMECDEDKVVVRSFYGNLSVDTANVAARYLRKVNDNSKKRGSTRPDAVGEGARSSTAAADESDVDEQGADIGRQRVMSCVVS